MTQPRSRSFPSFGIVPAAGVSRRMGQPKLKMPWGNLTVVEQVLTAWRQSGVDHVVTVVRGDDHDLARLCERAGAIVVIPPIPPPEMKDSVEAALAAIAARFEPGADAVWLLAPADMPRLSATVIDRLLEAHRPENPAILVPIHTPRTGAAEPPAKAAQQNESAKRGHPVLFPWPLAHDVARLNEDEGVNVLVQRGEVREVAVPERSILDDLDTPDDYRRLSAEEGLT